MSRLRRVERFFTQDVWTSDVQSFSFIQRFLIQAIRLLYAVSEEFRYRLFDARAAGLVYATLLSLVPVLAVAFSVLKAFGVHQRLEPILEQGLAPLGPKGGEITQNIIGFVDNVEVGVLGVVGVAGLFYTTYALIDRIEEALNAIWRVRLGRSLGRKFSDYLSVVLVGPVVVMSAVGILATVQQSALVQRLVAVQPFGAALVWGARLVPFVVLSIGFAFLYKLVPNTKVRLTSAFVGGLTAAILWVIAGQAFAAFVAGSARYSAIYSGFAILILFLLWLYVGWLIILIGAQVSFFHQHPAAYQHHVMWHRTHAFREELALRLLVLMARRHYTGERPYRSGELANELDMPLSLVEEHVQEFLESGLLCRMSEPEGIGFVKSPDIITVKEILDMAGGRVSSEPVAAAREETLVEQVLRQRDQAIEHSLAGMTLRTLALEEPGGSRLSERQNVRVFNE